MTAQVVLEEAMRAAIEAGRDAAARSVAGDARAAGEVMAYYNVLDVMREQASLLGVVFRERDVASFDPEELLVALRRTQSQPA